MMHMNMVYPKIKRVPLGGKIVGKNYWSEVEMNDLLSGDIWIEEKIDGKTYVEEFDDYVFFGEYCKWKHSIPYDKLPAWFICFDVLDKKTGRFMHHVPKTKIIKQYGLAQVPLICKITGNPVKIEDLPSYFRQSAFSTTEMAEGIVIKDYERQLYAKLVRMEFVNGITDHWMTKKKIMNKLAEKH